MAADAIPAAVPGPNDPPQTSTANRPAQGLIASMLAPVDPARPAFSLDPQAATTGADGSSQGPASGASSAAYHPSDEAPGKGRDTAASGRPQQGIVRAWLLAGAERWKKGAGANIKRLEVAKARAMAQQVKEMRQVKVNRADAPASKAGPAAAPKSGGAPKSAPAPVKKSMDSKSQGPAPKGPKNSGTNAPTNAPAAAGGGKAQTSAGAVPKPRTGDPKPSKAAPTKAPAPAPGGRSTTGSGKTGPQGPAGPAGKPATVGARGGDKDPKGTSGDSRGRKSGDQGGQEKKPAAPGLLEKALGKGKDSTGTPGKDGAKPGPAPERKADKPPSKDTTDPKVKPTPKTEDKPADAAAKPAQPTDGKPAEETAKRGKTRKPFSTRESRETGYRDGSRAARTTAHVKAYADGVKDGWTDTLEAAEREKAHLDKTREDRKNARDKEKPVTGTHSSADYHQPQPIGVKDVTRTHVFLGDGAARPSMTRGEVRSLKNFERRLRAKADALTKVAEETRGLKAHADQQARKATELLEAARSVKGGNKVVASLTKLEEAAKVQALHADEIYKRALRAAEACRVVLTNAETRYGGIYQAVVDSDETAPAELAFYKG